MISIAFYDIWWGTDGDNGDKKCSGTMTMNINGGTKGACRYVSIPILKSVNEMKCAKSVGKVNHTLGVKLTHTYIGSVWE